MRALLLLRTCQLSAASKICMEITLQGAERMGFGTLSHTQLSHPYPALVLRKQQLLGEFCSAVQIQGRMGEGMR